MLFSTGVIDILMNTIDWGKVQTGTICMHIATFC